MNKDTRNAIERATQRARKLLEEDVAARLEGDFDVHRNGVVAAKAGGHLSARQLLQREHIVAAIEHKRAAGFGAADAVADYLRDVAFTTLNRFVALKMLEARELVQECITKGEQSTGYREYCGMAPGLQLLPDSSGYRLYIESLFDELSTEVKVLFDRRDPSSVLWPKRATFEQLLEILNATELARVWSEDETIGWVYQFFNSKEERAAMRDTKQGGSQTPRNSRELAVRNQFFTPRYVVQFLTDNTLGRIWYEMRTNTVLAKRCDYMVCKPGEELASRAKKDPRDLHVLDPACGSGHFLLYAFDLLLPIYEEAHGDADGPKSEATGNTLTDDYPSLDALRKAVPGLILAHNLHGVDIDPRCAQIAQLALWMRAQKAYHDFGINRAERSQIRRSNVVVAEPLVADEQIAKEFVAKLGDVELARVFTALVDSLNLAGDMGLLLRVETLVKRQPKLGQMGDLFAPPEERIRAALARFVSEEGVAPNNTRRRLFVDDTAHGIDLLSLAEKKFDVVLMNPPFGLSSDLAKETIDAQFKTAANDLGAVFVTRGLELLAAGGRLGVIANRTLLAIQGFSTWRREILDEAGLRMLVDLGHGVLDAMVETAMFVCGSGTNPSEHAAFLSLLESSDKKSDLDVLVGSGAGIQWRDPRPFEHVTGAPWAYWVPTELLLRFSSGEAFQDVGGLVCQGPATADDFRFYRLRWEVPRDTINVEPHQSDSRFEATRWSPLTKGGEYSLWWDDIHLLVDWGRDGAACKAYITQQYPYLKGNWGWVAKNTDKLFRRGATYAYRTTSAFGVRLLPPGCSFSVGGWAIFAPDSWSDEEVIAIYNTRIARYFLEVLLGQGDSSAGGTAARNHGSAAVGGIPWPRRRCESIVPVVRQLVDKRALETTDETAVFFSGRELFPTDHCAFNDQLLRWWNWRCDNWLESTELYDAIERTVTAAYDLSEADMAAISDAEGSSLSSYPTGNISANEVSSLFRSSVEELTARAKDACGAKRYTVKKAYFLERSIDLACHILRSDPRSVIEAARSAGPTACGAAPEYATLMLSWLLGRAVGRFDSSATALRGDDGPSSRASLPKQALEEGSFGLEAWVDDPGHQLDIVRLVRTAAEDRWPNAGDDMLTGAVEALAGRDDLRSWYRQRFFEYHARAYSKSRRKAPIYWQLSTSSASYSLWLSYRRLSSDTLYKVLSELVVPKLAHEERLLTAGAESAGGQFSASQRRDIASLEKGVDELRSFRDEIARVAPLWSPNLNDGVLINFAPLWRLVPQDKSWQKELKSTWDALCDGNYDWAHLAMHLWPERVVPKCAKDRSLAIAHELEGVFWVEGGDGKWTARKTPTRSIEDLVRERSSPAVSSALKSLLAAPVAQGKKGGRKRAATVERADP